MNGRPWTARQIAILRRDYPTTPAAQLAAVLKHPAESVANKAKKLGIRKRGYTPRRHWTEAEIATLRKRYPDFPTKDIARDLGRALGHVYQKAIALGLHKSAAYLASPHACRLRRGDNVGAAHRFQKGHVPANKGLRRPGWHRGRMRDTQFKKGHAPHTWMPVGSERVAEGYRYTKVSDIRNVPWTRNWRPTHVLLWEKHHGPVPKGYAVGFINRDKADIRIENLMLLSRGDLARLNVMWNRYPRELARVIQLRGALRRRLNRRNRHEEQDQRSA